MFKENAVVLAQVTATIDGIGSEDYATSDVIAATTFALPTACLSWDGGKSGFTSVGAPTATKAKASSDGNSQHGGLIWPMVNLVGAFTSVVLFL